MTISDATIAYSNDTVYKIIGSTATVTCNSGYLLTGAAQYTCQSNGMWAGNGSCMVDAYTLLRKLYCRVNKVPAPATFLTATNAQQLLQLGVKKMLQNYILSPTGPYYTKYDFPQ